MIEKNKKKFASIFIIGIFIAGLLGLIGVILVEISSWLYLASLIFGIIISFMYVSNNKNGEFLLALASLTTIIYLGTSLENAIIIGPYFVGSLNSALFFLLPIGIRTFLKTL